jgi:hypothetical protein
LYLFLTRHSSCYNFYVAVQIVPNCTEPCKVYLKGSYNIIHCC